MKTVTLDILNDHVLNLLKDLEKMKVIKLKKNDTKKKTDTMSTKKVSFQALSIDTKNFHFDRNEANER